MEDPFVVRILHGKDTPVWEVLLYAIAAENYVIYLTPWIMGRSGNYAHLVMGMGMGMDPVPLVLIDACSTLRELGEYVEQACVTGLSELRGSKRKRHGCNGFHIISFDFRDETLLVEINEVDKSITVCHHEER
jgi:hypothetical protein